MIKKSRLLTTGLVLFLSLLIPRQALANAIIVTPLSIMTLPILPVIVIIEIFIFWLSANKIYKTKISLKKITKIIVLSNIITLLLSTCFSIGHYPTVNVMSVGLAFVFAVFIEWHIYIWFLKKDHIHYLSLLRISYYANLITYAPIIVIVAYNFGRYS